MSRTKNKRAPVAATHLPSPPPAPPQPPVSNPMLPSGGMSHEVRMVGPEEAKGLLEKLHPFQRSVVQRAVANYVAKMLSGQWVLSPHGLVIDADGHVVDGQHRLLAVVKSGATVPFHVTHLPPGMDATVIDRGTARTAGHVLEMSGVVDRGEGKWMAAAATSLILLARCTVTSDGLEVYLERVIRKYGDDLREARRLAPKKARASIFFAAYAYALPCDPAFFRNIFISVRDNDGLEKGSGAWHLHQLVMDHRISDKMAAFEMGYRILRCLQAAHERASLRDIRYRAYDTVPTGLAYFRKLRAARGIGEDVC